jgi:hypothetical protein
MANEFPGNYGDITQVPLDIIPITPHDTNALDPPVRAIQCRGAVGTVTFRCVGKSTDRTLTFLSVGEIIRGRISHVRATGTNATTIVGLE